MVNVLVRALSNFSSPYHLSLLCVVAIDILWMIEVDDRLILLISLIYYFFGLATSVLDLNSQSVEG